MLSEPGPNVSKKVYRSCSNAERQWSSTHARCVESHQACSLLRTLDLISYSYDQSLFSRLLIDVTFVHIHSESFGESYLMQEGIVERPRRKNSVRMHLFPASCFSLVADVLIVSFEIMIPTLPASTPQSLTDLSMLNRGPEVQQNNVTTLSPLSNETSRKEPTRGPNLAFAPMRHLMQNFQTLYDRPNSQRHCY